MKMDDTEPDPTMNPEEGHVLFFNGQIYTVNEAQPWAEAILVVDGIITMVGDNQEVRESASESAKIIDLEGAFMMPGIHDVHMHPFEAASDNFKFTVDVDAEDPEDYLTAIIEAHADNPGNDWLLGWGYDLETLLESTREPIEMLDEISTDRPIAVMEQTSHSVWCNSTALSLMGITIDSDNPVGGIIMRNEREEPNGILMDNAGNILVDLALPVTAESKANDYAGLLEFALPELAKHGITSICDARTYWKRDHHLTWKKLADDDELTVRVNLGLWAYPTEDDDSQLNTIKALYNKDDDSLLKINQIKLYSDGIVHNTTSAMHDDFLIDYFGEGMNNGLNYFTESRIAKYIRELEPTGFDFHIHTIGNRGVHEALNAIEAGGTNQGRHRLTHVEYIDQSDFGRFASLNVTADAQVAGDFTNPQHWHDFDYLLGSEITDNVVPLRSLSDNNTRITLSSDWDVSTVNPFVGIQNVVTRQPQQLNIAEAISAYTINPAYVMRQENKVGSIEIGKEADLIILDQNILSINPMLISNTKVQSTYLQGELIYNQ